MRVFVVAIGTLNVTFESVHGEVHFTEADGFRDAFNSVDADLSVAVFSVSLYKIGTLNEHAAGAAGGVEDSSLERLNDLDNEFNEGGWCEELAAACSLGHGEVAEEIFVDFAEGVALYVHWDTFHDAEQFEESVLFESVIGLG